jgi:type I restriction enzyme R subunit
MAHAKRLNQAFRMCSSSELLSKEERANILFFAAVRAVIFKSTQGEAPDVEEMNIHVRKLMQEAMESSGVEEVVKIIENKHGELDLFDPEHLERIEDIKLPNIRMKLLERLLRQQISELGKINKVKAIEFVERLNNLIKDYNDRSDDAVFATEVMQAVTKGIKDMMAEVANEKNNLPEGIDNYEEKAFYDILKVVSDSMKFNFPEDKMISIAKEIKEMITSKSQYTDCFKRADIMAEMQFDIIIILAKYKYPPVGDNYDEVYKKVLEQAENFKKYQD